MNLQCFRRKKKPLSTQWEYAQDQREQEPRQEDTANLEEESGSHRKHDEKVLKNHVT